MIDELEVTCSSWLKAEVGVQPCLKKINRKDALHLTWTQQKQNHDCYFCSWECLKEFIENSYWMKK